FTRNRPTATTSAVEDAEADARVGGQPTQPVRTGPVNGSAPEPEPSDDDLAPFDDGEPVEFDPLVAAGILRAAALRSDAGSGGAHARRCGTTACLVRRATAGPDGTRRDCARI